MDITKQALAITVVLVYGLEYIEKESKTCRGACRVPTLTQLCWATRLLISSALWNTVHMTVYAMPRMKMKKTTHHEFEDDNDAGEVNKIATLDWSSYAEDVNGNNHHWYKVENFDTM